jgi:hypothetical protein
MWIRPRKIVAQWLGQESSDQETSEAPSAPPAQCCDVCGSQDHARDACPSTIRPGDVGTTWRSGGNPNWSSGTGDTFEAVQEFWRRFRGEG